MISQYDSRVKDQKNKEAQAAVEERIATIGSNMETEKIIPVIRRVNNGVWIFRVVHRI